MIKWDRNWFSWYTFSKMPSFKGTNWQEYVALDIILTIFEILVEDEANSNPFLETFKVQLTLAQNFNWTLG